MTNEYGSDSQQEHETDHAAGHENAAPGTEAGVWPDDQPPHDDFGSVPEDMATVSQEAATESETDEAAISEAPSSRSMLPIFAGIGGILLLAVLIYWQFGHSSPPAPPAAFTAAMAPPKPATTPTPPSATGTVTPSTSSTPPQTVASANTTANSDIDTLYKPATASGAPAATTVPIPSDVPSPTAVMAPPGSESATPPPAVAPANGWSQPQMGQTNNPVPPPMADNSRTPNNTLPVPAATVNWGSADPQQVARINALTARIDDLQKSIDQENRQLNQVSNMVAAQQVPVPTPTSQSNPEVEGRLAKIEQALMKIENDQITKPSAPPVIETPRYAPRVYASRSVVVKHSRHIAHKKPKTVHHKHVPAGNLNAVMSPPPTASSPWVLRAATPKEAWISGDSTSSELRRVQVGDSLTGVGVVRSIHQSPAGWEIEGTVGTIH